MTLKNRTVSLFFHLCQQHVDGPRLEHPPRSWRSKKQSAGAGLESCSAQSGMARTCNVIPVNLIAANCNDCSLPFPMVVLISYSYSLLENQHCSDYVLRYLNWCLPLGVMLWVHDCLGTQYSCWNILIEIITPKPTWEKAIISSLDNQSIPRDSNKDQTIFHTPLAVSNIGSIARLLHGISTYLWAWILHKNEKDGFTDLLYYSADLREVVASRRHLVALTAIISLRSDEVWGWVSSDMFFEQETARTRSWVEL